jgi:hypothetical protein
LYGYCNFRNNTYPQRKRHKSNLGHIFREKMCVLWAGKYGIPSVYLSETRNLMAKCSHVICYLTSCCVVHSNFLFRFHHYFNNMIYIESKNQQDTKDKCLQSPSSLFACINLPCFCDGFCFLNSLNWSWLLWVDGIVNCIGSV